MTRLILHLDMDAFYTSIEQRDRPEYRGQPVVVGADPKGGRGRGVVAAASYEARRYGIRSAMPISQAYRKCPHGVYLRPNMKGYASVSRNVMSILSEFTDRVEQISIDEAFLDVTDAVHRYSSARDLALEIKQRIREKENLGTSIGIAPNKFVAKIASDLEKPDGLVEVPEVAVGDFLGDLPVERLWGVGPRTAEELHKLGLYKIRDISRLSLEEMERRFGRHGRHLHQLARGEDDRPVVPEHEWKSLGQETTFDRDTSDSGEVRRTLLGLAEQVGRRLRQGGLMAGGVTLKFRDEHFVTETRASTLKDPTDDATELFEIALRLLARLDVEGRKVRLLGVYASKLAESNAQPRQLRLFANDEKRRRLNRSLDRLEERFGDTSFERASLMRKDRGG